MEDQAADRGKQVFREFFEALQERRRITHSFPFTKVPDQAHVHFLRNVVGGVRDSESGLIYHTDALVDSVLGPTEPVEVRRFGDTAVLTRSAVEFPDNAVEQVTYVLEPLPSVQDSALPPETL